MYPSYCAQSDVNAKTIGALSSLTVNDIHYQYDNYQAWCVEVDEKVTMILL